MFVSSEINLYELLLPKENEWNIWKKLWQTNMVMIAKNEEISNNRTKNINSLKRVEELKNCITDFKSILEEYKFPYNTFDETKYLEEINNHYTSSILGDKEEEILKIHRNLKENCKNLNVLIQGRILLHEKLYSIVCLEKFFPHILNKLNENRLEKNNYKLTYFLGTIPVKNTDKLTKILFRLTKNNTITKFLDLNNNYEGDILNKFKIELVEKKLFLIVIPFDNEKLIYSIKKLLESFDSNILNFFEEEEFNNIKINLNNEINDNCLLINQTKFTIEKSLLNLSEPNLISDLTYLNEIEIAVLREQLIFNASENFNQMDENLIYINFWMLKKNYSKMNKIINNTDTGDENFTKPKFFEVTSYDEKKFVKPTYHMTSEIGLTKHFQTIVDTYGIPNYNEINPGIFTVIGFPFCFGLMFGDIGHGSLILFFGLMLFLYKGTTLYDFRYLFLLLGFFSTYCGLVYNEFFSIPLPMFNTGSKNEKIISTYPFGFDWIWFMSANEINFFNSFKMKFSIIFGVIHMSWGIFLKGVNARIKKNKLDFFFEFIPQIVFMLSIFGYMSFLIIFKWLFQYDNPPSIIEIFINLYTVDDSTQLFDNRSLQKALQLILISLAWISVLLMLIPKPLILILKIKNKSKKVKEIFEDDEEKSVNEELILRKNSKDDKENESDGEAGEIIIHQFIETIEFVWGSISNTASYLRLWALSLAHGQLSKVFLDLILANFYKSNSIFWGTLCVVLFAFPFFIIITFGVLLIMDFMECFLHALRLHWVEFQNKFYKGNGVKFELYNFKFN